MTAYMEMTANGEMTAYISKAYNGGVQRNDDVQGNEVVHIKSYNNGVQKNDGVRENEGVHLKSL